MEMEEMDFEYWEIIVRRRWMILGLFVAAVVIALVLSLHGAGIRSHHHVDGTGAKLHARALLFDSRCSTEKCHQNYVEILKTGAF